MSLWDFAEALTGKGREELKAIAKGRVAEAAKEMVGVYVCECYHLKPQHGPHCTGMRDGKKCGCREFKPQTKG